MMKTKKIGDIEYVNLTPHPIRVQVQGLYVSGISFMPIAPDYMATDIIEIPPSGIVARVEVKQRKIKKEYGVMFVRHEYGEVHGIPEPREKTIYIVSSFVLNALRRHGVNRDDIVAPDTSPESVIRDDDGNIVAVRAFVVL